MRHRISTIMCTTKYRDAEHVMIAIDGEPLDQWLASACGSDESIGLVPAISQMVDERHCWFALWRSIPKKSGIKIAPLLVCPDDVDLWCITLVAEVERRESTITWNRLGYDHSDHGSDDSNANVVGTTVSWLTGVDPLEFDRREYLRTFWLLRKHVHEEYDAS